MREFSYRLSKWFLMIVFVFGFLSVATTVFAAEETPVASGAVNCFDYYHFNSVKADIEGTTTGTIPGIDMTFKGNVVNENEYPIVAGSLYAKIFKKQSDEGLVHANGHDLVDQFFVQDNMSLPAKGSVPVEFKWKVPSYAVSGDYQIAFFFTSAKKYNLLGLSFTDDIVGNTFNFKIVGEEKDRVFFNKNTVKVGDFSDKAYRFASAPPHQDSNKDIPVTVELVNPLDTPQTATVIWKVYGWDAQSESNLLDTKTETINLAAKETKSLQYVDTKRTYSVHLLVAEARYRDTKSILDIRYVREGVDTLRINFPSITSYPLEQGKENTVFSCAHNAGVNVVPGNKIVLTLRDQTGNTIHTYSYDGAISGDMMGVKDNFTPKETYKNFSLEAQLYRDGKVVDQATVQYDCEKIVGVDCPKKEESAAVTNPNETAMEGSEISWILKSIIAIVVILLGTLLFYVIRNAKNNRFGMFVFALVFVSGLGLSGVKGAEAKDAIWNMDTEAIGTRCAYESSIGKWVFVMSNVMGSVSYHANVTTDTGKVIESGSILPVGSKIQLSIPRSDTDIYWFAAGAYVDSPYGTWKDRAKAPSSYLDYEWKRSDRSHNTIGSDVWVPLSVNPPADYLEYSKDYLDCDEKYLCTIKKAGSFSMTVNFPSTYGQFSYARKFDLNQYKSWYAWTLADGNGVIDYPGMSGFKAEYTELGGLAEMSVDQKEECSPLPWNKSEKDFAVNVPKQTIQFDFRGGDVMSNPPKVIITGPTEGFVGDTQSFKISASDTDAGDTVTYEINWNAEADNFVDESIDTPSEPSVEHLLNKTNGWSKIGTYIIKVRATDNNGAQSEWASHTIDIREKLIVCPVSQTIKVGDTVQMEAYLGSGGCSVSDKAKNKKAYPAWLSSDSSKADVADTTRDFSVRPVIITGGLVTGRSAGVTTITGTYTYYDTSNMKPSVYNEFTGWSSSTGREVSLTDTSEITVTGEDVIIPPKDETTEGSVVPIVLPTCSCDINTANQKCDYETFAPKITPCSSSLVCYGKKSCPRSWNEIPPTN